MTESNLAANLLADSDGSHSKFKHFDPEIKEPSICPVHLNGQTNEPKPFNAYNQDNPDQETQNQDLQQELNRLRQEVSDLKQCRLISEQEKITASEQHLKTKERLKREIKTLKLELRHTESTAQELQRSLQTQLQHNWEQQQHELMTSVAKLRAGDQERLTLQESQIQELNEQKLLLEKTQQELIDSLEAAMLELTQNAKAFQKIASTGNSHNSKTISMQAVLEQSLRSLQNEYTNSQNRIKDLEAQLGDLQEQVLRQSAQALEFEAAIQHWKERYITHQNYALQLCSTLERFMEGKDIPKLGESAKVDLPSFLVRQRL